MSQQTAFATRERPIIMTGQSVRAILDGRKTQTRRVVRNQSAAFDICMTVPECRASVIERCSYGQPGDRLWVREGWSVQRTLGQRVAIGYNGWGDTTREVPEGKPVPAIDPHDGERGRRVRSPIHMPRWASRLTLEITSVGVQRIQDISTLDIQAEGVSIDNNHYGARNEFRDKWNALNGARGNIWSVNPWVWVLSFRRVEP